MDAAWIEIIRQLGTVLVAGITGWAMYRTKSGDSKENPVARLINAQGVDDAREVARLNRELGRAETQIAEMKRDLREARDEIDALRSKVARLTRELDG